MNKSPDFFNALRMAFGFLTILPIPQRKEWSETDFGWSAAFYPLTGAVIGGTVGAAFLLLTRFIEKPIAAFLTLIIWILLSGGLHWDGLADCMDGFGCSADPQRRLEIMKDPRLGSYGVIGVFCSLILKWLCLWYLPAAKGPLFFSCISASARWAVLLLISMPLANSNGLAAMLKMHCPKAIVIIAAPIPLVLGILCEKLGGLYLLINFAVAGCIGLLAKKKISGINGDVLGFTIELGEIILLLATQVIP